MANRRILFADLQGSRGINKRVPATFAPGTQGHGFTSVPDGSEDYIYEVSIDLAGMRLMASKAASNKIGISNDGPLQVKITQRIRKEAK